MSKDYSTPPWWLVTGHRDALPAMVPKTDDRVPSQYLTRKKVRKVKTNPSLVGIEGTVVSRDAQTHTHERTKYDDSEDESGSTFDPNSELESSASIEQFNKPLEEFKNSAQMDMITLVRQHIRHLQSRIDYMEGRKEVPFPMPRKDTLTYKIRPKTADGRIMSKDTIVPKSLSSKPTRHYSNKIPSLRKGKEMDLDKSSVLRSPSGTPYEEDLEDEYPMPYSTSPLFSTASTSHYRPRTTVSGEQARSLYPTHSSTIAMREMKNVFFRRQRDAPADHLIHGQGVTPREKFPYSRADRIRLQRHTRKFGEDIPLKGERSTGGAHTVHVWRPARVPPGPMTEVEKRRLELLWRNSCDKEEAEGRIRRSERRKRESIKVGGRTREEPWDDTFVYSHAHAQDTNPEHEMISRQPLPVPLVSTLPPPMPNPYPHQRFTLPVPAHRPMYYDDELAETRRGGDRVEDQFDHDDNAILYLEPEDVRHLAQQRRDEGKPKEVSALDRLEDTFRRSATGPSHQMFPLMGSYSMPRPMLDSNDYYDGRQIQPIMEVSGLKEKKVKTRTCSTSTQSSPIKTKQTISVSAKKTKLTMSKSSNTSKRTSSKVVPSVRMKKAAKVQTQPKESFHQVGMNYHEQEEVLSEHSSSITQEEGVEVDEIEHRHCEVDTSKYHQMPDYFVDDEYPIHQSLPYDLPRSSHSSQALGFQPLSRFSLSRPIVKLPEEYSALPRETYLKIAQQMQSQMPVSEDIFLRGEAPTQFGPHLVQHVPDMNTTLCEYRNIISQLKQDERHLQGCFREMERKRTRPPTENWWEIKDSSFGQEHRRHLETLETHWKDVQQYREELDVAATVGARPVEDYLVVRGNKDR
ncbi:hypothetical protein ADUPG1_012791 [Aduncisulcus paluster]|uniref:Uncharacterized protein n=1 Tax=Aduncisulcus paluster TaxID=2918883 RepID=A0ABQ5K3X2_9EUKA|nr:hypothetical protein ADUPG1_012791 [Aduncisulcus paluster]